MNQYNGDTNIITRGSIGNSNIVNPQAMVNAGMQPKAPPKIRDIYLQMNTKNKSFLDMHHYLKSIGVTNNAFMLALIDPDLANINPHDPHLNPYYKQKVLRECLCNVWYFLREVVRVPSQGGIAIPYKLTRGNMAMIFCMTLNLNVFVEMPRLRPEPGIMVTWCKNDSSELLESAKALRATT